MKRRTLIAMELEAATGVSGSVIISPPFPLSLVVASERSVLLVVFVLFVDGVGATGGLAALGWNCDFAGAAVLAVSFAG